MTDAELARMQSRAELREIARILTTSAALILAAVAFFAATH